MAKTTKKPAVKTTAKTQTTTKKVEKKSKITLKHKVYFILVIIIIASAAAFIMLNKQTFSQTQINTPVIARTELSKKENIEIKLFDKNAPVEEKSEEPKKQETTTEKPNIKALVEPQEKILARDLATLTKQVEVLEQSTNTEEIVKINAKLTKLESLNGNVGNLSKIFLGQQLVLLDNAFKVGGNQNLAITNIYNFAKNVAKNEAVANKLQDLLNLTNQQAIITPMALNFYASELKTVELSTKHIQKQKIADNATTIEKIKAYLKSFIIIREKSKVTVEQALWNKQIAELQKAIIFTDFIKVEELLANEELAKLGGENFANFAKLFATYLTQQQALQATLGAFIEGYNYDY